MLKEDRPLVLALLAIAAALLLNVAAPLPVASNRQDKTTKTSTEEEPANVADWLHSAGFWEALFTGFIAIFAFYQISEARKGTQRQLRAYIHVTPNFIRSFDVATFPAISAKIENTGQTPAYAVRHRMQIELLPEPPQPGASLPDLRVNYAPPMVVHPNSQPYTISSVAERRFTGAEITQIRAGSHRIYVYGEVLYRDAFFHQHWTRFCSCIVADSATLVKLTNSYGPSNLKITFQIAPMGNDAD
jgi:hypothetical protein